MSDSINNMLDRQAADRDARRVPCPTCEVPALQRCLDTTGHFTEFVHSGRHFAAGTGYENHPYALSDSQSPQAHAAYVAEQARVRAAR